MVELVIDCQDATFGVVKREPFALREVDNFFIGLNCFIDIVIQIGGVIDV